MNTIARILIAIVLTCIARPDLGFSAESETAPLPAGVQAVWDLDKAYHEATPTRERICLNGLWQWQPAAGRPETPPTGGWGYFKVPGCWPGISDYMQKDCQRVFVHPAWKDAKLGQVAAAWYRREIMIPSSWAGRRVSIRAEYLNSYAAVFLDGQEAGELHFPGGELEITPFCRAATNQILTLLTIAMPLKGVMLSYTDSASAREVRGAVARRGLCGDVYLVSTPGGPRITRLAVETSVRGKSCSFDVSLDGLLPGFEYSVRARIREQGRVVKELVGSAFTASDLREGRVPLKGAWLPDHLWDVHTPQNVYDAEISLVDHSTNLLDRTLSTRFGFREFWIDGRDFMLNGTRIYLSAVPLDNAEVSAALATYEAARESLKRLKSFGINYVYTHNYGCEPGSHLGFEEILRAADDVGMLVGFSQPHFSHYDWKSPGADRENGYARHAAYYVRAAQNHPSVVMYSMSHNATGYNEDMNPDMIDGIQDDRDNWAQNNTALALRAEAIVKELDTSRPVYHHASGNLGSMHAINFYPNFAPVQELSDWFEHWATKGVKPVFTCEYGAPFTWDWAMYRGWYQGQREFGSAKVPWEFCLAEWNAQFFGDRAFQISECEKANLRWEAAQFRAGKSWHRWDYPCEMGSARFEERYPVFALYLIDNWRAFRTWSVSALSPWEHEHFWKLREGVNKSRREFQVDWAHLQRPGFSPDFEEQRYERMDLAFDRSDWIATPAAQALIRNNRPLLAYIAGKPGAFTSKDHNFFPGETLEKQVIVINNSRETVTCDCRWSLGLPQPATGQCQVKVATGQQARTPLRVELPVGLSPGRYELGATFRFGSNEVQDDTFLVNVIPPPAPPRPVAKLAVFDPQGETRDLLARLGIRGVEVNPDSDLSSYEVLLVGKSALTVQGPAPDISRVREGFKVLIFEQAPEVLQKRFGFRVEEYGLRRVFARVPDHPVLVGIPDEGLLDWRGDATILPSRLKYQMRPRYGTTVEWCGLPVTRLWRCGNRGNVASVLIEKPAHGNFLPLLDGGYNLQYSPLMEYREGRGLVLFCQVDVTGRTEIDPAAEIIARNLVDYVSSWTPSPRRRAAYAGGPRGRSYFDNVGLPLEPFDAAQLTADRVLLVGDGAGDVLATHAPAISEWLKAGGHMLAIGLDQKELDRFLPFKVATTSAEHISTFFEPFGPGSLLTGVGPADVHNRDPRQLPLLSAGVRVIGDGVLGQSKEANVLFCQIAPWQFNTASQPNLRRTYRRAAFLTSRLLANLGVAAPTPILERFHNATVGLEQDSKRWLSGLYVDQPEEWDDPYRFFRW